MPSRIDWPTDAWPWWLSLLAAFGLIAVVLFGTIGFVIYLFVGEHTTFATLRPDLVSFKNALLANVFVYPPICLYLAAILPSMAKVRLADLGFRRPTRRDVAIALVAAAAMWVIVTVLGAIIERFVHHADTEAAMALLGQAKLPLEKAILLFVFAGIGPICEELIFRVFLFNAFSRYATVAVSAILSGTLFGLIHITRGGSQLLTIAVPLAVGGVILAYVYAVTRNYWASVITHGTFNAATVLLAFFFGIT